jgi:hypothetical protein
LYETWKWGQNQLNKIDKQNKMNHKGPANDEVRILYDLAILVRKVPNYLSYKAKLEAQQAEAKRELEKTRIDYDNVQKVKIENNNDLDDISGLLDDIF